MTFTILDSVLVALAGSLVVNFSLWRANREVERILAKIVSVLMAEGHPMFVNLQDLQGDNGKTASSED